MILLRVGEFGGLGCGMLCEVTDLICCLDVVGKTNRV